MFIKILSVFLLDCPQRKYEITDTVVSHEEEEEEKKNPLNKMLSCSLKLPSVFLPFSCTGIWYSSGWTPIVAGGSFVFQPAKELLILKNHDP